MRGADWDEAEPRDWSPRALLVYVVVGVVSAGAVAALALTIFSGAVAETDTGGPEPPAEFDATVDPGSRGFGTGDETVTIRHEGGERIDAGTFSLRVVPDGASVDDDPVDGVDWPDDGDGWGAGERATYAGEVPRNASLVLVWTSERDGSAQILAEWDVEAIAVEDASAASSPSDSGDDIVADAFTVPLQDRFDAQSHVATAFASRSCAVGYEIRAGWPPRWP